MIPSPPLVTLFLAFSLSLTQTYARLSTCVSSSATATVITTSTSAAPPVQTSDSSVIDDITTIYNRRVNNIVSSATKASSVGAWLSTIQPDGSWPASEVDYTSGCDAQRANWPAENHWTRLVTLAAAFHGGFKNADQWNNNATLGSAISLAMDYWFSNDFTNIHCLDAGGTDQCPCGTPGFWNTNWFSNIIGVPKLVSQTCLLLNSTLTNTQYSNCTNILGRSFDTFNRQLVGISSLTGANALDVGSIGADFGTISFNATAVTEAYQRVHNEVILQQAVAADGIRPDGSFGQHDGVIYNGNYGKDYTNDVLSLEMAAGGTQFGANSEQQDAFTTLAEGNTWMIYRNIETNVLHWDFSVIGRMLTFPVADSQASENTKMNITQFRILGELWNSDTLLDVFNTLNSKDTSANSGSLSGTRVFYDNDFIVQRGDDYVVSVRMFSNRTRNSECINTQNPFGFHLSDGTVYNHITGSEYEDIPGAWDWNLIPGITVDYNATELSCGDTSFRGIESFVGGATDGEIGLGAMRYTNPLTKSLSWQKAWFLLDGGVQHVMINSINSLTDAPVFSVLDQRRHISDIIVDGNTVTSGNFTNATSLWHGNIGYTFSSDSPIELNIDSGNRTGNWSTIGISTQPAPTVDFFKAWISHPDLSTPVSYSTFLAVDQADFADQANEREIIDIRNDKDVSAILDVDSGIAMFVFWNSEGGNVTVPSLCDSVAPVSVATDRGLLVILDLDSWNMTVSDPTQAASVAQVNLALGDGQIPDGWTGEKSISKSIELPSGLSNGSSITQFLFTS